MALSQADFYAYSRATGAPVPRDPEEQAQMAPAVLEFRRNQLKAPASNQQQGPDLGQVAGVGAALAGLTAGAYGLARILRQKPIAAAAKPPSMEERVAVARDTASRRLPTFPSIPTEPQAAPPTPSRPFSPRSYVEDTGSLEQRPTGQSSRVPTRANQPGSFADLTSIQDALLGKTIKQQVEATDPGLDQALQREVFTPQQREVSPFAAWSRDADRISEAAEIVNDFPQEAARINYANNDNIWEVEELLERGGEWSRAQQAAQEHLGRTVVDLTGEIPITYAQAERMRNADPGIKARGRGNNLFISADKFSDAAVNRGRFTPDELLERTMAAASYPREIRDKILDPSMPREKIAQYLGTAPKIRGGAVSTNPTLEIAGGARASMPGAEVDDIQTRYDPNTGNYYSETDAIEIDPTEMMSRGNVDRDYEGANYADVEGVGNLLVDTEAFTERTNKGTTRIPGAVKQASGFARDSSRLEREIDSVLPVRRDEAGIQTPGVMVTNESVKLPFGLWLRLQDSGAREKMGIETNDINVGTNKLVGGFEVPVDNVPETITTQPVTNWAPNVIKGADGEEYVPSSRREVVGETELVGFKRTPLVKTNEQGQSVRVGWQTLQNTKPQNITLNRVTLQSVADDAQYDWFNNPSAKLAYLQEMRPDLVQDAVEQGIKLNELGEAYDYQGFIAKRLDDHLMNQQGIDLPLLKPQISKKTGAPYYPAEANAFVTSLLKTEKDTPVYGNRIMREETGKRKVLGFNAGGYPIYDTTEQSVPVPGKYSLRGGGGVDPMTVGDDYEGDIAFYTPRVGLNAPKRTTDMLERETAKALQWNPLTQTSPTGGAMVRLRSDMETNPVGYKVRSPGAFARTQNPYTGAAAAAMGPAARANQADYQYTDKQLEVVLQPMSQRQAQQREQFEYAAHRTPGGRVVTGALNLGGGMGAISAGLASLPSESATISKYGVTGGQLKDFGNRLMAQAAYSRGIQPGPTSVKPRTPPQAPTGSAQMQIPYEGAPTAPRGYTPNSALDFYQKALERDAARIEAKPQRMVRRQGRMVPVSETRAPAQLNMLYPRFS